jgi:hypothetical protein
LLLNELAGNTVCRRQGRLLGVGEMMVLVHMMGLILLLLLLKVGGICEPGRWLRRIKTLLL